MSLDYSTGAVARTGTILHGVIANGTVLATTTPYIWCKNYKFLLLGASIRITAAATTDRTHTFKVQKSDTAGAFGSPTDILTISIATTDAAATTLFARATTDLLALVEGDLGYVLRVVHVATGTDATLDYDWEVFTTSRHE